MSKEYSIKFSGTGSKQHIYKDGDKIHRVDGPAIIEFDKRTGNVIKESWYQNDKCHRTDGPAIICYYPNGDIHSKHYYINGLLNRPGITISGTGLQENEKATIIEYGINNIISLAKFIDCYKDIDGKTLTLINKYSVDGIFRVQEWFSGLNYHRVNGPSKINYKNGIIESEEWRQNGVLHRTDGPAIIFWDEIDSHTIYELPYYIRGKRISSKIIHLLKRKIRSFYRRKRKELGKCLKTTKLSTSDICNLVSTFVY